MIDMEEIKCLSCDHTFTGQFCNNSGEKVYRAEDKSFKHLLEKMFHFISHFNGKFLTAIKHIYCPIG